MDGGLFLLVGVASYVPPMCSLVIDTLGFPVVGAGDGMPSHYVHGAQYAPSQDYHNLGPGQGGGPLISEGIVSGVVITSIKVCAAIQVMSQVTVQI